MTRNGNDIAGDGGLAATGFMPPPMPARARSPEFMPALFPTFFMGGFECSTHRRHDRRRLDLVAATRHDRFAAEDYGRLARDGVRSVRDGARWHLIETAPGRYDWSSFLPMLRAAERAGVLPIWDLCHYGWPDDIDIFSAAFVERFARFAGAVARVVREETGKPAFFAPVNEISYWAWAGGDAKIFNPMSDRRGNELKRQLVRAAIAAIDAIRAVEPRARIVSVDPLIKVHAGEETDDCRRIATDYCDLQYAAWDMIAGFNEPGLGGRPDYLDVIGVNYYNNNQWFHEGPTIWQGDARYEPLRNLLVDTFARFHRPVFIAETGSEGPGQGKWLRYVAGEARAAILLGVPLEGICIYPVTHYPAWDNERLCDTGLYGYADDAGGRELNGELHRELKRQQAIFANFFASRGRALGLGAGEGAVEATGAAGAAALRSFG